jgi:hypothetical protein
LYFVNVTTGGYGLLPITERVSSLFLCALLNSSVLDFHFKRVASPFQGGYFAANKQFIEQLPVPLASRPEQSVLEKLVASLLFLHRQPSVRTATSEHLRDSQMATWLERWVNALVYELFFPEEMHAKGLSFFPLAEDFAPLPPSSDADAATLASVRATVKTMSAPGHALRRALDQLQTLDLVRTIEGGE